MKNPFNKPEILGNQVTKKPKRINPLMAGALALGIMGGAGCAKLTPEQEAQRLEQMRIEEEILSGKLPEIDKTLASTFTERDATKEIEELGAIIHDPEKQFNEKN